MSIENPELPAVSPDEVVAPVSEDTGKAIERLLSVMSIREERYSGPLPPAKMFREYAEIDPEIVKTILRTYELQTATRLKNETQFIEHRHSDNTAGRRSALAALCLMLSAIAWAIWCKAQWTASVLGGGTIYWVVKVFIRGNSEIASSKEEKRKAIDEPKPAITPPTSPNPPT